jgi:hypothetical protein
MLSSSVYSLLEFFQLKFNLSVMSLHTKNRKTMTLENQIKKNEKRISDAKHYWSKFLSYLPLRVANLSSSNHTSNIYVKTTPEISDTEKIKVAVSQ